MGVKGAPRYILRQPRTHTKKSNTRKQNCSKLNCLTERRVCFGGRCFDLAPAQIKAKVSNTCTAGSPPPAPAPLNNETHRGKRKNITVAYTDSRARIHLRACFVCPMQNTLLRLWGVFCFIYCTCNDTRDVT